MTIEEQLTTLAQNVERVYSAGKNSGYTAGENIGYENGKTDGYAQGYSEGEAVGYKNGKTDGEAVAKEKPFIDTSKMTNFKLFCSPHTIPQAQLKNIDCSNGSNAYQMFMADQWNPPVYTEIPKLDTSKILYMGYMFQGCSTIETIEGIDFSSATQLGSAFSGCTALRNMTVNGIIKASSLNTAPCTLLSKASIESIINALSPTTSALTVTLSKAAVNTAFETEAGLADGSTSQQWADLIATKSNWTISLA